MVRSSGPAVSALEIGFVIGSPAVPLPLLSRPRVFAFALFFYSLPILPHPFLRIVNPVDSDERIKVCEPQHAITPKFLPRVPALLANR